MTKILALALVGALSLPLAAQTALTVGGTPVQPPLTFADGSGLAKDIVTALNGIQTKYHLDLKDIPARRVNDELSSGELPVAMFNNIHWGFDPAKVNEGPNLLDSGDKYFALAANAKDQTFFEGVGKVETIGVIGFSYKYAGFETKEDVLKAKFHTTGVEDEAQVIKMVLAGRGKIGVASVTALDYLKKTDPGSYAKLLVSKKFDSEYTRTFLLSKQAALTPQELAGFMNTLAASGKLAEIYAKYGLIPPKY